MFEKFKETLTKRIEENSVKSELSYVDREGNTQTEIVYMKRGKGKLGDWHQVYLPVKDDGSNKWHLPNALFGGTKNFLKLIMYLSIFALFMYALKESYANYDTLANLPCVKSCLEVIGYG